MKFPVKALSDSDEEILELLGIEFSVGSHQCQSCKFVVRN